MLIQQQRTVARHADQHIARALVLHHVGSSGNFLIIRQPDARDLAQLVVVRLDEERLVGQHVHEQIARGIDHGADAAALQPGQQPLIGRLGQAGRNAARQHQNVILLQGVELLLQRLHGGFRDVGARAVEFGLLPGLDLDVDAGHTVVEVDEIGFQALRSQAALQPGAGLARHKAEGDALAPELGQHAGHIDALAAQHAVLAPGAVDVAHLQLTVQPHNVINRRVECHGVDHCSVSFTSVSCLYFGSGQRFVRIAPL